MRLFLAIELPTSLRTHLQTLQTQLRPLAPNLHWTRPENLHLTLKFLGEVPDSAVPGIVQAAAGIQIPSSGTLQVENVIFFPTHGHARIVAAELNPAQELLTLHHHLENALAPLGHPKETRPFRPHITLARARQPLARPKLTHFHDVARTHLPGPSFQAAEFVLMHSQLAPAGATYTPLARFALKISNSPP